MRTSAAISRDGHENPVITEDDLLHGCKMQMRGSLQMRTFAQRVVPKGGLEELVLSDGLREQLQQIVDLEKARTVLFGQWGFHKRMRDQQSTTVVFWGTPGSGKNVCAEALGFEIGQPLKVVNYGDFLTDKVGQRPRSEFTQLRASTDLTLTPVAPRCALRRTATAGPGGSHQSPGKSV